MKTVGRSPDLPHTRCFHCGLVSGIFTALVQKFFGLVVLGIGITSRRTAGMIERIGETRAVSIATPSAGRGGARRQKRLKWLATLREAQDEAAPLVDEIGAGGTDGAAVAETRARIADALSAVDEMRGRLGG